MASLFEGVCETHVILTPGACGSGAPNSTSCHHFRGTAGQIPDPQFRCGRLSKNRLWDPLEGQFSRTFQKEATRDPNMTQREPKRAQGRPKAAQREPKRAQGRPKASQTGPKAAPKRDKRSPMASQRDPKEPPGTQKGVQRKPIYKNSRSTAPAAVMFLCYLEAASSNISKSVK